MSDERKIFSSKTIFIFFVVTITFILFILLSFWSRVNIDRRPAKNIVCQSNLKTFGMIFYMYALDNSNSYPAPQKWCDTLSNGWIRNMPEIFHCPSAQKARCNYALNPNCEPNSPPDTVLLFETKGGWNLSGGPELLSMGNHGGYGCNVLLNSGSVDYVRNDEIENINWGKEENE